MRAPGMPFPWERAAPWPYRPRNYCCTTRNWQRPDAVTPDEKARCQHCGEYAAVSPSEPTPSPGGTP